MHPDVADLQIGQRGLPILPETLVKDDLVQDQVGATSCHGGGSRLVGAEGGPADCTEVKADQPMLIAIKEEPFGMLVIAQRYGCEGIVNAAEQVGLLQ